MGRKAIFERVRGGVVSRYSRIRLSAKEAKTLEIIGSSITQAAIYGKQLWEMPMTDEQAMQLAHFAKQGVKVRLK